MLSSAGVIRLIPVTLYKGVPLVATRSRRFSMLSREEFEVVINKRNRFDETLESELMLLGRDNAGRRTNDRMETCGFRQRKRAQKYLKM